jgi:hypothetical protein
MRLLVLLALVACSKHDPANLDKEAAKGVFEQVSVQTPPGMSDLTIDDRGVLWSIAERDREIVEIELATPPRVTVRPLDGVPKLVDTEALAWLGNGRFAIGTEGALQATASIMFAELDAGRVTVKRTVELTGKDLGVELTINHGIEALCGHGDEVLAATETVGKLADGTRYSALAWLSGNQLAITKVRLTTNKGKLSALHCTFDSDGTAQVIAIERHYSVSRILRFAVKRGEVEVTPTVELDLAPILRDSLNLEGIARLPDGRLVAINDNQGRTVKGPTQLLVFVKR